MQRDFNPAKEHCCYCPLVWNVCSNCIRLKLNPSQQGTLQLGIFLEKEFTLVLPQLIQTHTCDRPPASHAGREGKRLRVRPKGVTSCWHLTQKGFPYLAVSLHSNCQPQPANSYLNCITHSSRIPTEGILVYISVAMGSISAVIWLDSVSVHGCVTFALVEADACLKNDSWKPMHVCRVTNLNSFMKMMHLVFIQ